MSKAPFMEPRSRTTTAKFPAERARIRELRQWARNAVSGFGIELDPDRHRTLADTVALVLSELGTNAVLHGCGGDRPDIELTARLHVTIGTLRMSITDPSHGRPELRTAGDDATSGRGLQLVAGHTRRWGVESGPSGKTVWAEMDLPDTVTSDRVGQTIAMLRAAAAFPELRPRPAVGTLRILAPDRIPA
ncbi:ATP-binding protein [Kitasatospora sp. NPDC101447]|uniref:ATP-binding protein n=1 Tax=Kitasatospora sp. NPDC101447 TaxID=3364102 RepID=UPI00382A37FF